MQDFEKLGVFYLGRLFDRAADRTAADLLLYDSRDLVTHAVCVGMTGSGKTGLCLALLEEAAIDGIPALAIDPKGDIGNLLLTFPELRGEDFAPWVNAEEARKQGITVDEYAQQQAELWKNGLAEWGQDGDRIRRLRQAADFVIYTPGSTAGVPLSVLKSFAAPEPSLRGDAEAFRDLVSATVSSLLGLLGIEADPVQSREHILLANLLAAAWQDGRDLSLGELIRLIQAPPMRQVGVIDMDSFFPAKERFALAMQLNNLLASPGFEAWMTGEPLDVGALLHTPEGKPRIAIVSIAHLGDAERMFVVSLLLNQVVSWVRAQPGTTSLRAILYMDEIFGYFPPVANPPSKLPLLTLLKQARAYGLGVVLATQNPVDLDYKGLANTGTWFIGRLQTERDKARLLDGLAGAATAAGQAFDRDRMEQTLSGLGRRVFLMNNVHEDEPVLFEVRWDMSYLRGPLTRTQIKQLMDGRKASSPSSSSSPSPSSPASTSSFSSSSPSSSPSPPPVNRERPVLPPEVKQFFLPIRTPSPPGGQLTYEAGLIGYGQVFFADAKVGVEHQEAVSCLARFAEGAVAVDWQAAEPVDVPVAELEQEPAESAHYAPPPASAYQPRSYAAWTRSFTDHLYRTRRLTLFRNRRLNLDSEPLESDREFRVRLQQAAREARDAEAARLREAYGPKVAAIQERIRKAEQVVARESEQATHSKFQTAISFGATILGAFLGRKTISSTNVGKAATAIKGAGRSMKEAGDVTRARENVAALEQQRADLEGEFQRELDALAGTFDPMSEPLESVEIRPKKSNIQVELVSLVWVPSWTSGNAGPVAAWK